MSTSAQEFLVPKTGTPTLKMKYTNLGSSGLKVSRVILGGMGYGSPNSTQGPWVLTAEKSLPLIKYAFDAGINTWDTADVYSQGRSEEIMGQALREYKIPRSKVVIMTKLFFGVDEEETMKDGQLDFQAITMNDGPMVNRVGLSRKHISDAVEDSVRRLGTYIDVLQIHRNDPSVSPTEIMRALNDVIATGKVRYIGASSMPTWQFQLLNNTAERNGWHTFISMQNYHNLLYREEEREMHPYCQHAGVGLVPWSPLAGGMLARPFKETENKSTDRAATDPYSSLLASPDNERIINKVEEVAKTKGVRMAQVAIAWSLLKGVNPILGLHSESRIDEAVGALSVELSEEDVKALESVYVAKPLAPVF